MSWIERAEEALSGGPVGTDDVVLRGARPPLLDADGFRAVAAPLLAAVVWSAAVLREVLAETSIDPIALGLRVVALGLTVRVVLLGARLIERIQLWAAAQRHAIVLTPEGLFVRSPDVDVTIPREDVVGVVEPGRWQERGAGRRTSPVYVITDPASGRTHVALPPVFDGGPGPLAERLMRWRGGWEEPEVPATAAPHDVASKVYDDAAAGRAPEGVTAIRHGRAWMKKGPYAVLLIAVAAVEGMLRGGSRVWEAIDPMIGGALAIALVAVFARWVWMERRDIAPAKGLSLVLTPAELLIRTRSGILRTPWRNLVSVSVRSRRAWSVLEGAHDAKQLVLSRRGAGPIRYDEPYLGIPAEVAQLLIEAYRIGRLPTRD